MESASSRPANTSEGTAAYKRLTLEQLMQIRVTSVSKRPEPLADTASAIQVVTGEEIRRSGAVSLPQALRLADNLQVAQKSSHEWGISARGFNTALVNKLLVLLDGRTIYTPLFSGVFWEYHQPYLADVDRIEVVSGPGSAVWGANAVNGLINVISKPARETQGLHLEVGAGAQPSSLAGARWGGALGQRAHYRVYGNYSDYEDERLAGGGDANDGWHRAATGFRVDGDGDFGSRWTFQGDFYDGEEGLSAGDEATFNGGNLLGRWTHDDGQRSGFSLQAYFDWSHLDLPVPALLINGIPFAPSGVFHDDLQTVDVELQRRTRLGTRHEVTWGLGYRNWRDDVQNAPALGFVPPDHEHRVWNGYFQDEFRFRPELTLQFGVKLEHNDYTGLEIGPTLRFGWRPVSHHLVWGAVSRAFRTPSRLDRELSQPVPPYLVLQAGNPDFDSETVIAYELGHRAVLGARSTVSLAAFYNDYDRLRSTRTTSGTILPFRFGNDLTGETYGFELSGRTDLGRRWRLHGGYTFLEERLRVRPGGEDFNAARNETSDPSHQLALRTSCDLPRQVELDAALRWVDDLPVNSGPAVAEVPSYVELDLRVGWRPTPELGLEVVGRNLLQDQHPEYGYPTPDRVEIRRAVLLKLTWRPN